MKYSEYNNQVEKIIKAIKENKGFNFDKNGDSVSFDSGYWVGGYYKCLKLTNETLGKGVNELWYYLVDNYDYENSKGYIGVWKKDSFIYLDISKCIKDLEKAKEIGFYHNQIAIYDIKNDLEIILDNDLEM
jgi:hypothetical protein